MESSRYYATPLWSAARLSPDPELADEGPIALDVSVSQVVQQTPLLAHQEKEAAARVVVFGVRLQVLSELSNARGRKRYLDFRGPRVPLSALVIRDQLAFDAVLYCQTRNAVYGEERRGDLEVPSTTRR